MTYLNANWPAPSCIHALTTTKMKGYSKPPFAENNLGLHVGDNTQDVLNNRKTLVENLHLTAEPIWLGQTHSNRCIVVEEESNRNADAAITRTANIPLAIMTADCLPIMICNNQGTEIAAIHAGWRGLVDCIIENTLQRLASPSSTLLAWIGPGICGHCFQIGPEVREQFIQQYYYTEKAFVQREGHWYGHLALIAELILINGGVSQVFHSNACTYESTQHFYSYRRHSPTGRMATLIWFSK